MGRGASCRDPECRFHMHLKHCGGACECMRAVGGGRRKCGVSRQCVPTVEGLASPDLPATLLPLPCCSGSQHLPCICASIIFP